MHFRSIENKTVTLSYTISMSNSPNLSYNKCLKQRILGLPYELQLIIWRYHHRQLMRHITSNVLENKILDLWGLGKIYTLTTYANGTPKWGRLSRLGSLLNLRMLSYFNGIADLRYSS